MVILFAKPLVVVRVVDGSLFNHTRVPTKCGLTLRAPHLIAALDFENAGSAGGASFGCFFDLLC